ncbi:MAG TPA: hypothetical protein VFE59_20490 [Trebonia sp.]|nr:hypothetical protein [Trebonia sp.]
MAAISDDDAHPAGAGVSQTVPADNTHVLNGIQSLHERLDELQHVVAQGLEAAGMPATSLLHARIEGGHLPQLPAWRRHTEGEARWQVALCTAVAIALQVAVPDRLTLLSPSWALPALQGAMLICLIVANPHRINRQSRALRSFSLMLATLISFANAWSLERLASGLVSGHQHWDAGPLLITGGAIWLTNVIVFGLWYWEFDRGGPVARALGSNPYPDFQFPQMVSPEMAPPHWEPQFADYLYLAFTNAAAFSPTDVMPLSRWAKLAMTLQSAISIVTVALVVARAVNILQ